MELKILTKKENPLLKREEIEIIVEESGATPNRKAILAETAKLLGSSEDLIIVDKISNSRGKTQSSVKLFLYKKTEDIPQYKLDKMTKRITGAKKAEGAAPSPEKTN